jgi:N-methylhydantoinase A
MDILGLAAVLVPQNPGNVSAFGLLTVDVKNDYVRTAVARHDALDLAQVQALYADLQDQAAEALDREGFPRDEHRYVRTADLRYVGQAFEVRVPVAAGPIGTATADDAAAAFHDAHEQLYGYSFRDDPRQHVEWVNLRVSGVGPITRPVLSEQPAGDGDPVRARTGARRVFFDEYVDTPIYWRPDLAAGDELHGPAVVEEFGSTVPVHPGFVARVDALGNIVVRKEPVQ